VSSIQGVLTTGNAFAALSNVASTGTLTPSTVLQQSLTKETAQGQIFFWVRFSDGNYKQITDADFLSLTVATGFINSIALSVRNGNNFGTVPRNAENGNGEMISAAWQCSDGSALVIGSGLTQVKVDLPVPTSASLTVSGSQNKLTRSGDAAEGLNDGGTLGTSLSLFVTMSYQDGSTVTFTSDDRTSYTSSDDTLLSVTSTGVVSVPTSSTTSGKATVTVTFPTYTAGASLSASIELEVVLYASLQIAVNPYDGSQFYTSTITTLQQVQCTGIYQRGRAKLTAVLTDGKNVDVSTSTGSTVTSGTTPSISISGGSGSPFILIGEATGSSIITGGFKSTSTGSTITTTVLVVDTSVFVTAITDTTSWSIELGTTSFVGTRGSTKSLTARITFSDSTQFSNFRSASWITPSTYLMFASASTAYINLATDGTATLLENFYDLVDLTTSSTCASASIASVSTTISVYPNLDPSARDVDLGNSIGQQFTPITTLGGESTVNVYINSETRRLQFFKVTVLLETAKLQVVPGNCVVGSPGWSPRNFGCNDALETDKVIILGGPTSSLADAALGSSILVASFKVKSLVSAGVALIEGTIDDIIDRDASSGVSEQILGVAISVGRGYMKLSGERRRLLLMDDVYGNVTTVPHRGTKRPYTCLRGTPAFAAIDSRSLQPGDRSWNRTR